MRSYQTIPSPNGTLEVDFSLRALPGIVHPLPHVRVRLGKRLVVGWTRLGNVGGLPPTSLRRRALRDASGTVLMEEVRVGLRKTACVIRITDDAVAFLPAAPSVGPELVWPPSTFRHASVPFGGSFVEMGLNGFTNRGAAFSPAFLTFRHGGGGVLLRDAVTRASVLIVGDAPTSLLVPRGLRSILREVGTGTPCAEGKSSLASSPTNDSEFNVRYPFLVPEYALAELRRAGFPSCRFIHAPGMTSRWNSRRQMPNPPVDCPPTEAHLAAYELLTDPRAADAASGFRGEFGEYMAGARRRGDTWIAAGFTHKPRVLTLFFPYLSEGVVYRAEWQTDDDTDEKEKTTGQSLPAEIRAGDKAIVKMADSGGYLVTLTPVHS